MQEIQRPSFSQAPEQNSGRNNSADRPLTWLQVLFCLVGSTIFYFAYALLCQYVPLPGCPHEADPRPEPPPLNFELATQACEVELDLGHAFVSAELRNLGPTMAPHLEIQFELQRGNQVVARDTAGLVKASGRSSSGGGKLEVGGIGRFNGRIPVSGCQPIDAVVVRYRPFAEAGEWLGPLFCRPLFKNSGGCQ